MLEEDTIILTDTGIIDLFPLLRHLHILGDRHLRPGILPDRHLHDLIWGRRLLRGIWDRLRQEVDLGKVHHLVNSDKDPHEAGSDTDHLLGAEDLVLVDMVALVVLIGKNLKPPRLLIEGLLIIILFYLDILFNTF